MRFIERDVDEPVFGEVVRQRPPQGPHVVEAPIVVKLDVLDVDLQHMAGPRPAHRHRPRADVARQFRRHALMHCLSASGTTRGGGGIASGPPTRSRW